MVHDTWARSYRMSPSVRAIDPGLYFTWHRKVREQILARSLVLVSRDEADPDYVYGYIVAEAPDDETLIVHWAYVRARHRKERRAWELLGAALAHAPYAKRLLYTHRTYFAPKAEAIGFAFSRLRDVGYEIE